MNDQFPNSMNPEDDKIAQKINQVAEQTHARAQFAAELEERLRNTPQKTGWLTAVFRQASPALRWAALMILLAIALSWSIKTLIPASQLGSPATPDGFICPVTQPNGSLPPGTQPSEMTSDPNLFGNGELWTVLWPNGKVVLLTSDQRTDGSFAANWPWYRGVDGELTIEGHRLDAQAAPLLYELPEGFNNFQGSTLIFPTTGCWEITGRLGSASLTFVTEVLFEAASPTPTMITTPDILVNGTTTPAAESAGYDWRGTKLYLGISLPESPSTAHVYVLNKTEQATAEQARALADQFGIQGEMYTAPGLVYNTADYVISDGKQSLQVHSDKYFTYTADMARSSRASVSPTNPNAEEIIREFLNAHGFDFPFRVYASDFFVGYIVQPLAPDSIPMQYESFTPPMMRVVLDENGQVLTVDASLMNYDPAPVGEYGIITAQEAFERMLDDYAVTGKIEFMHSPARMPKEWYRAYPDNQPVTTYGYVSSEPALDPSKPALLLIGGVPLVGNISGLESLEQFTYVKATGQYFVENGIRKFNVESWDRKVEETFISGILQRNGDQIILTSDDGSGKQYPLIDPPVDVPLDTMVPETQLSVAGTLTDGKLFWTYIQFLENYTAGGGGGGGGLGFYKLNLSGSPVPFPSPTPRPDVNSGTTYEVQENDTLASIALNFGVSVDALAQANDIRGDNIVFVGQTLVIPGQQGANNQLTGPYIYTVEEGDTCGLIADRFRVSVQSIIDQNKLSAECIISVGQNLAIPPDDPVMQQMENLRGYLSISIHNKSDGTSTKEYNLEVTQENGSAIHTLEGSMLSDLDIYNQLPILITGTINTSGKLVVESYKIPYPDLQFQILRGTQRTEQLEGQNVVVFTTEGGTSYVEFLVTNTIPNDHSLTGYEGDLIEQEVLIIPDETFGGMPVAHIYQSSLVQEGSPAMEAQANRIPVYNEPDDPLMSPDYVPPGLTIDQAELVYFVSNPYYQVNDPNYSQRSTYIQPVWHFHGRYEDGSEFDVLIQALKQEFLLPELVPNAGVG